MSIKICFGKNDSFWAIGSRIVRSVENNDSSHAWIEIDDMVFEAVWPKTRMIKKIEHQSHYDTTHEFVFPDYGKKSEMLQFLYKLMGKRYSTFQLFTIWLGNSCKYLDKQLSDDNFNGKAEIICTELAARFMSEFYQVNFGESFDMIGINDLMNKCKLAHVLQGGYK